MEKNVSGSDIKTKNLLSFMMKHANPKSELKLSFSTFQLFSMAIVLGTLSVS